MPLRIVVLRPSSGELEGVKKLWRSHSATLGFFPEGAFADYAARGGVLAAVEDDVIVGYVLVRETQRRRAAIAHLCVEAAARGKGIARMLFAAVKNRLRHCDDIVVRCRRDFNVRHMWPRLGFVAVGEEVGRGRDAAILTIWRHELNPLPLLAALAGPTSVMRVAIDANVFFDLGRQLDDTHESLALVADWLPEFLELCVTSEILNEINRCQDTRERDLQRSRANHFHCFPTDHDEEQRAATAIRQVLRQPDSERDQSDERQLAKAAAGDAAAFVTRDDRLLKAADALYDVIGLAVVSPYELISRIDEIRREHEYRPRKLCGPDIETARPKTEDLPSIATLACSAVQPTPDARAMMRRIQGMHANSNRFDAMLCRHVSLGVLTAFFVERPNSAMLRVSLFVADKRPLAVTAAHHFADQLVRRAVQEGRRVVEVVSPALPVAQALLASGFAQEGQSWFKLAVTSMESAQMELRQVVDGPGAVAVAQRALVRLASQELTSGPEPLAAQEVVELERTLWPLKIGGSDVPCFIVPISARWAAQLFDFELAQGLLFGANPELALRVENAYYRAARPRVLEAPSRVLWYVSQDQQYQGTMSIRACSYIDEIVIGPPKDVFRRFRRLGVYAWKDVFDVAKKDLTHPVMGFQFSGTEPFSRPIQWTVFQEVLRRHTGKPSQLQSPLRIEEACFLELYAMGVRGRAHAA